MKRLLLLFFFFPFFVFGYDSPVSFDLIKVNDSNYKLKISVPKGYAIQKTAPNKIKLSGNDGLKVISFEDTLKGPLYLDKPEYFKSVEDLNIKLKGKGELSIDSRIFYCDLDKGVCYPARIKRKEKVF
ncbi:MAG: hypothetical protein H7A24_08730 [Leptospiraceae bacterium]|nr:hypothetical protein [Leptospiraceae bacterium]MCP5511952.1 hypothetical protein [Leptospiraceae bacterium]